jgi:hypothetical protein
MIEFMKNHLNLLRRKFFINFTTATAKKLCEECANLLNSMPEANK